MSRRSYGWEERHTAIYSNVGSFLSEEALFPTLRPGVKILKRPTHRHLIGNSHLLTIGRFEKSGNTEKDTHKKKHKSHNKKCLLLLQLSLLGGGGGGSQSYHQPCIARICAAKGASHKFAVFSKRKAMCFFFYVSRHPPA